VHVIVNALRCVTHEDRKKVTVGMRTIYTAPTLEAAQRAFAGFETNFGKKYPGAIDVWRRAGNEFIPFPTPQDY
jgi:putative transposase